LTARLLTAIFCAAAIVAVAGKPADAATPYVDGISDQSMPAWNGGFAESPFAAYFADRWVTDGHISYARYAVQWNVMEEASAGPSPDGDYRERLEAWYADASNLGLTLDVALTSYDGSTPSTSAQYGEQLTSLLEAFPELRYVEAWNEPNNEPYLQPRAAAGLANTAEAICRARDTCTAIVGDFLDSSNAIPYERSYERHLDPADPANWAIHPYYAVRELSEATIDAFEAGLPDAGAGAEVWFTEVGSYYCSDYDGRLEQAGEEGQEAGAYWLTHLLMPNTKPAHVFYFELLYGGDQLPPCTSTQADTSLYVPSGNAAVPARARTAAAMILGGEARLQDSAPAPASTSAALGSSSLAFLPF
jgi:hypothetical protein